MSVSTFLSTLLLRPLQLIFEIIYNYAYLTLRNPGLAIIALSLAINFLVLPLYRRADAIQEEERQTEAALDHWVRHIKKTFRGDERTMMLQTYYRQNHYSPTYVLRSAVSLFLEIPFFIAAYHFLSELDLLKTVSFGPIADLSKPDGLIVIGGIAINLLPFVMTFLNAISTVIFTKGYPLKTKIQLYGMAAFFLVFLYDSPSGLVFYWTLNNLFSLVKTIFYKLKNPRRVLLMLTTLVGAGALVLAAAMAGRGLYLKTAVLSIAGVLLVAGSLFLLLAKNHTFSLRDTAPEKNNQIATLSGLVLTVLTGLLIPSAIIKASPQEFINLSNFVHPLWFLVHSAVFAAGLFVLWFGVFYRLTSPSGRNVFAAVMWVIAMVAMADYFFLGKDYGLLNASLVYERAFHNTAGDLIKNTLAVAGTAAVLAALYFLMKKHVPQILSLLIMVMLVMTAVNSNSINQSIRKVDKNTASSAPHLTLSRTEKNVVVVMLDRAMNEYVPYILAEKPELKEHFDGFTYYPNAVSYGGSTNFGSPGLFGGYEYTPLEMNKRDDVLLENKHNDALRVMPRLFSENGYDVTFFDPVYAGYEWVPDLSIFDDYPEIDTYVTGSYFFPEGVHAQRELQNRNFFCHSLVEISPLALQGLIYNQGAYNCLTDVGMYSGQIPKSASVASGIQSEFMNPYSVLKNLPNITAITDKTKGTLFLCCNDVTHNPMLLSEPDYLPAEQVDNREYDEAHKDRFTLDGRTLSMEDATQYSHYQANMAAMLLMADWFDYLRQEGVYDNTRIILVSDHGRNLGHYEEFLFNGETDSVGDLETFFAFLLVKDFDSHGFTVSDEFMTNADVPTLATSQVIDNPINPFTGNPINNLQKQEEYQYIIGSSEWDTGSNNGTTFLPARWYTVHDNIWDPNNWQMVAENAILP